MMVVIPAGSYLMGSPDSEIMVSGTGTKGSERPQHRVTIARDFAMGAYEVAFAEWDECVRDGGCEGYLPPDEGWGRGWRPVINVSWNDAQNYVAWLSEKTGARYRLPSESEWEYAARAGTQTRWHWGDDFHEACRWANIRDIDGVEGLPPSRNPYIRTAECRDGYVDTAPVGSYRPNPFGLFDVLGNVSEWVEDCPRPSRLVPRETPACPEIAILFERYEGAPDDGSAWIERGSCDRRVWRGGSNLTPMVLSRSAAWLSSDMGTRQRHIGFRVVRELDNQPMRANQNGVSP